MPSFSQAHALNANANLIGKTALVVGGTSGLGQAIVERLAAMNATIIVSGRNAETAQKIISTLKSQSDPALSHSFLPIDLSSLSDISRFTTNLKLQGTKLDYLVITAGFMTLKGRDENAKGIDKKLCVHYYGRFKLIQSMLPEMIKWNTRVMSVLAAGKGGAVNVDDLDLKKHYSLFNAAMHAPAYNDLMVMELGRKYPQMSFTHLYPGTVNTSLVDGFPAYLRLPLKALASVFATSMQDFGEIACYCLTTDTFKTGAHLLSERGEPIKLNKVNHSEENAKIVWKHSEEVVE